MKINLLIRHKQKLYKLGSVEFKNTGDGSVYIFLARRGRSRKSTSGTLNTHSMSVENLKKTIVWQSKSTKISYHSTGRVHFQKDSLESTRFFAEPLVKVEHLNPICMYSIPKIEKLDEHKSVIKSSDIVINIDEQNVKRIRFDFSISPPNWLPESSISLLVANMFSLNIQVFPDNIVLPSDQKNKFFTYKPKEGMFTSQRITQDQATIEFQQQINNTRGSVIYPPNNEGICKIFFTIPMRVPPKINISSVDDNLIAVECSRKKSKVCVQFKVYRVDDKQQKHLVKTVKAIKSIEFDAELY